jgi:hypothetical protein
MTDDFTDLTDVVKRRMRGWEERIEKPRSPCTIQRLIALGIQGANEIDIRFNGQVGYNRQPAG